MNPTKKEQSENFKRDYEWALKFDPLIPGYIEKYFTQQGFKVKSITNTRGNKYFDMEVGADWLVKLLNKNNIEFTVRIDAKVRRNSYYCFFKKDRKILIESEDRGKKGWLQKTGTRIMYCFSNEEETDFVEEPIFYPICEKLQQQVEEKNKQIPHHYSYDKSKFVLIPEENVKSYEREELFKTIGSCSVNGQKQICEWA